MPASYFSSGRRSRRPATPPAAALQVTVTTKLLAVLLLLAAGWLGHSISNAGLASAYYFKADYYINLWQRKPKTLDQHSWQEAADAMAQAVQRHPQHPHYLLTQAKVNEWGWYGGFKTAEQIAENEQLYLKAIELRPSWPNAYADYAYFLGMVNFRITEAFTALQNAKKFGPFIPETFQRTFTIATHHWTILSGSQKAMGFQALEAMIKNSHSTYRQAVETSKQYQLQRQFCIYLRLKKAEFASSTQKSIEKDFCGVRP